VQGSVGTIWYGFYKFGPPSVRSSVSLSHCLNPSVFFVNKVSLAMRISDKRLTSIDLIEIGRKLEIPIQVYSRDNVPDPQRGCCFIINLDEEGGAGTHWTCFYRIAKSSIILYFDSYGMPAPQELCDEWIEDRAKVYWSKKSIQALESTRCGWFCVGFLLFCSRHLPSHSGDPRDVLVAWQKLFSQDTDQNDSILAKLFTHV
jgi:hypothetical protein